jgi:hypothetical protein
MDLVDTRLVYELTIAMKQYGTILGGKFHFLFLVSIVFLVSLHFTKVNRFTQAFSIFGDNDSAPLSKLYIAGLAMLL